MTEQGESCPKYSSPPVVQTRIGVQFSPLVGFRSGHFGLFWDQCLGASDWKILQDLAAIPKDTERFGDKKLRPDEAEDEADIPAVRMRLGSRTGDRLVDFQPNRIRYMWGSSEGRRPSYSDVRKDFESLYGKLVRFAEGQGLGTPAADLWEVGYVNLIPQGALWGTPSDWNRVLPSLFPAGGVTVTGHEWATYSGEWYFEIVPQQGRVKVKTQKVVANQQGDLALLLEIVARGEVGGSGAADWQSGIEIGHRSAIQTFNELVSPEAKKEWGLES